MNSNANEISVKNDEKDLIEQNFFVIQSTELNKTISGLYGFCKIKNTIYINNTECSDLRNIDSSLAGAYVNIVREGKKVRIIPDESGYYILYLYTDGKYWALSNSFYKLCDTVKAEHKITLDEKQAIQYINVPMSMLSPVHTLANEIQIIPVQSIIEIDIEEKSCRIIKNRRKIKEIPINSIEAVNTIDRWINKWAGIIHSVYESKMKMQFDLSGGFDSRIVFALGVAAGIDFNSDNITVHSIIPQNKGAQLHYNDDYEIAEQIAAAYSFELNKKGHCDTLRLDGHTIYRIYENIFMNSHKEMYINGVFHKDPTFHFGGLDGEPLRGKVRSLEKWISMSARAEPQSAEALSDIIRGYEEIDYDRSSDEKFDKLNKLRSFYYSTWSRNHYGGAAVNDFLSNIITFSPLADKMLSGINPYTDQNNNEDIIYALILQRIDDKLLKIPFANKESFDEKTLDLAEKISGMKNKVKHVFASVKLNFNGCQKYMSTESSDTPNEIIMKEIKGRSDLFAERFGDYGKMLLGRALKVGMNSTLFHGSQYLLTILAISKVIECEKYTSVYNNMDIAYAKAIDIYRNIIEMYPDMSTPKQKLAEIYAASHNYKEAIRIISSELEKVPEWYDGYVRLADLYFEMNSYEEACSNYEKAIGLCPEKLSVFNKYILSVRKTGDTEKTKNICDMLVEKYPGLDIPYAHKAYVAIEQHDLRTAAENLQYAMKCNPYNKNYLNIYNSVISKIEDKQ